MGEGRLQNDADIEEILRIALRETQEDGEGDLRERLLAAAAELDLSPHQVASAERIWAEREQERRLLAEYNDQRRTAFWTTNAWAGVITVLIAVGFGGSPHDAGTFWGTALFIAGVYALAVALNAWVTFKPGRKRHAANYAAWKLRRLHHPPPG